MEDARDLKSPGSDPVPVRVRPPAPSRITWHERTNQAMPFLVDDIARETAFRHFALPECLHVPIAAVDEAAISSYVGEIEHVLASGSPRKALLVRTKEPPPIDVRLPVWELPRAAVLHESRQVWVHVTFTRYRHAYRRAFPDRTIDGQVLSHAMNRRLAALMGFNYVRITPNSRGCNSS